MLTDGVQTVPGYRRPGNSQGNANDKYTIADAEKNTEDLCRNIKADGINIITIAFQLNSQPTRNLLRDCATSPSYFFEADSDAFIVKGLLGVVLAAYNGKSADEIRQFDIDAYFGQLNLLKHLSPTRGNGLQAMVKRIQALAA